VLYRLNMKRGLLLLIVLAAACGSPSAAQPTTELSVPTNAPPPTIASDQLPTGTAGEGLVATVNGEAITLTEFEHALARRQLEVEAADPATLRDDVLNQLIEQSIIQQGAAAQQITVSDTDVDIEFQALKDAAGSDEAWQTWLSTNLYTEAEMRDNLYMSLLNNRVRDQLTTDLEGNVRQVHARHILIRTEAEANDILARLQNGEDFAALAASLSLDETTRQQGGDLSWFTEDELLVPQLARAAFALQPGQIGGPVPTELGYHIVQTLDFADRPVEPPRRVSIAQARFENWLRPLLDSATIERYI
jgi:peptidyl-prolyl cis-trans isomerase C